MATREKARKKTKPEAPQETSQQFTVTDPISMADLGNIHTRKGKYPSCPPPTGPKTWELARKEKEEFEGSESDPTELYQILAELSGSEGELEEGLEPEIEPPI